MTRFIAANSPTDLVSIVTAIVAAATALVALLHASAAQRHADRSRRALVEGNEVDPRDPLAVADFLFEKAGPMSLSQYRTDAEVRRVVDAAIGNAEQLTAKLTMAAAGTEREVEALLLGEGDQAAAFIRIRLAIELELRRIAELYGVPAERRAPAHLLRALAPRDERLAALAPLIADLVGLANAAVHGAPMADDALDWARGAAPPTLRQLRAVTSTAA